jgi:N-acetylglucosamine-6-phosphate deacetylase
MSRIPCPGFIDLQVNGYRGVDFSSPDLTEEEVLSVAGWLREKGTAAFLPTVITSPVEIILRNLHLIAGTIGKHGLESVMPGIHLEGPFISDFPGAHGVHPRECIEKPDTALLDQFYAASEGHLLLLTLAADIEGAGGLCRHAVGKGIYVSLGHQMAGYRAMSELADAGAVAITHLGNGIPAQIPRHDNSLLAGLAEDRLTAMIITDGHHLPPQLIGLIVRNKGFDKIVVTSDVAPPSGLAPGDYEAFGKTVSLREDGRLYQPGTEYLAGSSALMIDCMNYLSRLGLAGYADLMRFGRKNPLDLVGLSESSIKPLEEGLYFIEEENRFVGS